MRPPRSARRTASVRVVAPSLPKMALRWNFTVCSLRPSRLAISRLPTRNREVVKQGDAAHPDDVSKEDLVALDPGESVIIGRYFRDFVGKYVAHCHNLAHEDHAMMFGWEIIP